MNCTRKQEIEEDTRGNVYCMHTKLNILRTPGFHNYSRVSLIVHLILLKKKNTNPASRDAAERKCLTLWHKRVQNSEPDIYIMLSLRLFIPIVSSLQNVLFGALKLN